MHRITRNTSRWYCTTVILNSKQQEHWFTVSPWCTERLVIPSMRHLLALWQGWTVYWRRSETYRCVKHTQSVQSEERFTEIIASETPLQADNLPWSLWMWICAFGVNCRMDSRQRCKYLNQRFQRNLHKLKETLTKIHILRRKCCRHCTLLEHQQMDATSTLQRLLLLALLCKQWEEDVYGAVLAWFLLSRSKKTATIKSPSAALSTQIMAVVVCPPAEWISSLNDGANYGYNGQKKLASIW